MIPIKSTLLLLLFCILLIPFYYTQPHKCATMRVDSARRAAHPELGTLDQFEEWLQTKITEGKQIAAKKEVSYTLPVVVHVIHNGEAVGVGRNISDEQIQSQIDVLNEDFRKLNPEISTLTLPPYNQTNWSALAADCEINFCLAKTDPLGNVMASSGIDRVDRNTKGFLSPPYNDFYIDNTIKPATIWDPNKYFNIWVVEFSISVIGYATFPANSTLSGLSGSNGTASTDGIVIAHKAFGRVGTLSTLYNKGKTTTHEVGHWLGLRHIWGDGACATDYCNDTPSQSKENSGTCPSFPQVTCNNQPNGDMFVNYMDYSPDECVVMFTNDQKTRMQTVMLNSPFRAGVAQQSTNCGYTTEMAENDGDEKTHVYPNPSAGIINIALPYQKIVSMEVFNTLGRLLYTDSQHLYTDYIQLAYSFPDNGIYFLKINTEQKSIAKMLLIHQ